MVRWAFDFIRLAPIFWLWANTSGISSHAAWFAERQLPSLYFCSAQSFSSTILGFMMSFKFFWLGTEITRWRSCAATTHWIIPAVFAVLLIAVLVYNWSLRKDIKSHVIPGISILLVLLIASAEWLGSGGRIIANLLLLSGAGYMMYRGILTERLATLNLGVILLAIWVICRFFESDISFVWRGIIFIALGLLCFLLNFSLIRKKKSWM